MSVYQALAANAILLIVALTIGTLMFSLLPASAAVLSVPINLIAFSLWRKRFNFRGYLVAIHLFVFAFTLGVFFLIQQYGRKPFRFLLDWA